MTLSEFHDKIAPLQQRATLEEARVRDECKKAESTLGLMFKTLRESISKLLVQVAAFRDTMDRLPRWKNSDSPAYDFDMYTNVVQTTSQALSGIYEIQNRLNKAKKPQVQTILGAVPPPSAVQKFMSKNTPLKRKKWSDFIGLLTYS